MVDIQFAGCSMQWCAEMDIQYAGRSLLYRRCRDGHPVRGALVAIPAVQRWTSSSRGARCSGVQRWTSSTRGACYIGGAEMDIQFAGRSLSCQLRRCGSRSYAADYISGAAQLAGIMQSETRSIADRLSWRKVAVSLALTFWALKKAPIDVDVLTLLVNRLGALSGCISSVSVTA
eukprot:TRINITY_DN6075_c0_g1_i1.p1 TRINITY_DN6075_c0_g1~~TRINITY_DN6075_c0_g1_i1.p1  ORF type:complete len:184 (+),score=0.71 TRINITY_DN6075_c0_g1_i1:29-553(+)